MPLTIEQALHEIPVLTTAEVVAGHCGLDRVIRWTHIVDHPDVVPWVREGNLLLTTAFSLMLHPEIQEELIPSLVGKGLAGMMVNVGRYMGEIPQPMIDSANRLNFPLISLPWEVDFVEVTHAIHERIINEQYLLSEKVFDIHKILTQLVQDGGGLDELSNRLSEFLKCSITIEDTSQSLLAYTSLEPIDEVRRRSIDERRSPQEITDFFNKQGLFSQLRQDPKPRRVDPVTELGLTLERITAPIMVGEHMLGYIWIIASERPLTDLDFLVIERGANVAALILSREQAVYEAEQRLKARLFESLMDPEYTQTLSDLYKTAHNLGLSEGFRVLVLENVGEQPPSIQKLSQMVESFFRQEGFNALVVERGKRLVVLVGISGMERSMDFSDRILNFAQKHKFVLVIGISSLAAQVGAMKQAFQEAMDAIRIGLASRENKASVWSYDKLGYVHHLLNLPEELRQVNYYRIVVQTLAEFDEKSTASLLNTLEVYLDNLSDIQNAVKLLNIHRNTLYQRLEKIQAISQVDLSDTLVIANLYLAIKDWRISHTV